MATKPPHACRQCGQATTGGCCEAKARRERNNLYDHRWEKARLHWLAKHPLCVECERAGDVVLADVVDHITPHLGDVRLFWDSANNWQSMCTRHHNVKSAKEQGRYY